MEPQKKTPDGEGTFPILVTPPPKKEKQKEKKTVKHR